MQGFIQTQIYPLVAENIEYDYHESESYNVLYWIEKIPNLNVRILDNGKVIPISRNSISKVKNEIFDYVKEEV